MAGNEIAVEKYVVRLSAEERGELNDLIRSGKRSAQLLTKARILLKDLSDVHFPGATRIILVQDNLGTHTTASLYVAFPAAESAPPPRTLRMALHAQAWKLARHEIGRAHV